MDDESLFPMHNAGIYRTHWAIQKKSINRRNHGKKKIEGQNKHIRSAETSKQKVFGPL